MENSGFANETMVKIDNIIIVKTLDKTFNFPSLDLVYIAPCENGTVISPDCQQKLFSLEHDTGGRFLLGTFLGEHERQRDTQDICYLKVKSPLHLLVNILCSIQCWFPGWALGISPPVVLEGEAGAKILKSTKPLLCMNYHTQNVQPI